MNRVIYKFLYVIGASALLASCDSVSSTAVVERPSASEVKALTQKVADWQLDHFEYQAKYRAQPRQLLLLPTQATLKYSDNSNNSAMLFDGLYKFSTIADNGAKYINWIDSIGKKCDYKLDDIALKPENQAIISIYTKLSKLNNDPDIYLESKNQIDKALKYTNSTSTYWFKSEYVYTTAPSYAELTALTGDSKYIDFMDLQISHSFKLLYDGDEQLYYPDKGYFGKLDDDGNKQFWARGSGWVLAALAKIIPYFEVGSERHQFYIARYQELANKLCELQLPNGAWPLMLLSEGEEDFIIESLSTSLITYGLAWGVNNGVLDSDKFDEPLFKGWYALSETVDDEGLVGYSQCLRNMSCELSPYFTELFTGGAFLNAGSELYLYLNK